MLLYLSFHNLIREVFRSILWTTATILAVVPTQVYSQDINPETDLPAIDQNEQILLAIKQALVDEAQSSQSEVFNLSWLDPKGRLFDSTIIRSNVEVKGIQGV